MDEILFVCIGAILGANSRFIITNELRKLNLSKYLYVLIINTSASFCLGLFLSIIERINSFVYSYQVVLLFLIGFLGSLSTFSSFIFDIFNLCLELKFLRAIVLAVSSLSFGIFALGFGILLGN